MLTRDTAPLPSYLRDTRVLCSCGAEVSRIEAGFTILRAGAAVGAEERRSLSCKACGRTVSVPLAREGLR